MPRPGHAAHARDPQMSTPIPTPPPHPAAPGSTATGAPAAHAPATVPASRVPRVVGAMAIIALIAVVAYFVISGWNAESTDDAYVTAHLTTVIAKVPAYVQTLHIDDNTAVKAGELLVELDPRDYAVAVEIAHANLEAAAGRRREADDRVGIADADAAQARAELAVARANATLAEANLKRLRSVSDARAISNERLDTGVAAADATRASVTAAETKVRSASAAAELARTQVKTAAAVLAQAQAALDQAQLNLSYTKITAVETGTIANKLVEEGNYVQPGQTLFDIVPVAPYVVANFKETQLERMRPGQAAEVRVDAYPHLRLKGHIDSLQRGTGSVFALLPPENATGNFVKVVQRVPVKIVFDDPGEAIKWISPGMSVEAEVTVAR
jgi:membrane fusion protein (multidrug efflux system)